MALQKVDYVNQETVITAENMNDIQDAIIAVEDVLSGGQNGQVFTMTPTGPQWKAPEGVTEEMKQALLQLASKVAYIDDQGQTYYDDLYNALYPPKTVVSITAVVEQGTTVIYDDTSLNDLKQYLTVTAKYDDNTTAILPGSAYTLSGTLEAGTSTVTVSYNSLTTTFTVNVTARPTLSSISAVYTQSGTIYDTDSLDSLKDDLVVTAAYSDGSTQTVPAADYTLSGALTEGTSTITVSYGGKTATFDVAVTSGSLTGYITVGNPTITNGILTVTDGNFVKTPEVFSPGNATWKVMCKYRVTGSTNYHDVFGSVNDSNASTYGLLWELSNSGGSDGSIFLSSNGTSWNIATSSGAGAIMHVTDSPASWLWVEASYDGTNYYFKYSSDGETFTTGRTVASANKIKGGFSVAYGLKRNGYLRGEIDLNECKIYIDGALWWKAIA